MRLADRVVWGVFWRRAAATMLAAVALHAAIELVDLANDPDTAALWRYPLRLPAAVVLLSPVALLVAACWSMVHLSRTGQLVALAALGRGARRAVAVVLLAGGLWGAVVWVTASELAPRGLRAFNGEAEVEAAGWVLAGEGVLYRVGAAEGEGFREVIALELDRRGRPARRLEAAEARRRAGRWVLGGVTEVRRGSAPRAWDELEAPAPIPRAVAPREPRELTRAQLGRWLVDAERAGVEGASSAAERGLRLALSLACPICGLLGVVLGVRFGQRPGVAAAAVAVVAVGYWAVLSPCWAMATAGAVTWVALGVAPSLVWGVVALVSFLALLR